MIAKLFRKVKFIIKDKNSLVFIRNLLKKIKNKTTYLKNKYINRNKRDYLNLPNLTKSKTRRYTADYLRKGLDKTPDTFVLYRIIGNDLYPRHKVGQSRENVSFILENEKQLDGCEKRWVINRIFNPEEEQAIIELLEKHRQSYIHIPFSKDEYSKVNLDFEKLHDPNFLLSDEYYEMHPQDKDRLIGSIYRLKNIYVMNNNGARNVALRDGKLRAKWILPWDGNTFLTLSAWQKIKETIEEKPYLKYFIVPMARITDNSQLLNDNFEPEPHEEPQIIFRVDSKEEFNENFYYGRRPKVELFWRLRVPGKWDRWLPDAWELKPLPKSKERKQFGVAGWVARLNSGMVKLEQNNVLSFKNRGRVRQSAIINTLRCLDINCSEQVENNFSPIYFSEERLDHEVNLYNLKQDRDLINLVEKLLHLAENAVKRESYSVIDKTTLPPSGNKQDYWHPAPYWWPNPQTKDGLPYIKREGERVSGTEMYEPESNKYDRTRLQYVFDDTTTLALAWKFTNNGSYLIKIYDLIDRFFVNPATSMTPHLEFAQVRLGHNQNKGSHHGIIEMKDFYYFLDALNLIKNSDGAKKILSDFNQWLENYYDWIINSDQGKNERKSLNNHGTYYDLQVGAIANYLNDEEVLYDTLIRAQSRITHQFTSNGEQPEELRRNLTEHYCCFNIQGWIYLAELAQKWGLDFWTYQTKKSVNLKTAAEWLLNYMNREWPYQQINKFDKERYFPIYFASKKYLNIESSGKEIINNFYNLKPFFHPYDGIRPFWNIGSNLNN